MFGYFCLSHLLVCNEGSECRDFCLFDYLSSLRKGQITNVDNMTLKRFLFFSSSSRFYSRVLPFVPSIYYADAKRRTSCRLEIYRNQEVDISFSFLCVCVCVVGHSICAGQEATHAHTHTMCRPSLSRCVHQVESVAFVGYGSLIINNIRVHLPSPSTHTHQFTRSGRIAP